MKKTHFLWLRIAIVIQFITCIMHSVSLFVKPAPENETQRQLFNLMEEYKFDMGAGFMKSMADLLTGLSSTYAMLLLFGALANMLMFRKRAGDDILKGMLSIQVFIFGLCFAVMCVFTFLPPIILTGMIFISLLAARTSFPKV